MSSAINTIAIVTHAVVGGLRECEAGSCGKRSMPADIIVLA